MESSDEFTPHTANELSRWLAENHASSRRAVYPVGGRTALYFGRVAEKPGMALSTSQLTRIVDYPARDMTITVEAGIRIQDLTAALQTCGQRLAVDVPQAHRATLGGAVATNTSGPRRFGLGTLRDYVIGVSAVDAAGLEFKAGGRVVKNVAGYDLCKMLVGSLGTLAVITQLTLKLRPHPEQSALLWAPFDQWNDVEAALTRLTTSAARPVAVEVLDPRGAVSIAAEARVGLTANAPVLCLGVEGAARELQWQIDTLKAELAASQPREIAVVEGDDAERLWYGLTEFQVPSEEPLTFKANLLPSRVVEFAAKAERLGVAVQAHAGSGIVIGHLPNNVTAVEAARSCLAPLQAAANAARGNLIVWNCAPNWLRELSPWGAAEPALPLMRKLKSELDPHNLLNPHRFIEPL